MVVYRSVMQCNLSIVFVDFIDIRASVYMLYNESDFALSS